MPVSVIAPTDIYFQDTSSPDITSWLWLFGDGNTSTDPNPTHTYSTPGVYVVTLEAIGPLGVLVFQDVVTVIGANYWPLNEVSGTRRDWYGGLNLTQNNGVSSVVDATGRAALFDAASSQYLSRAANGTELYPQGDYTISLWFYPTGTDDGVYSLIAKNSASADKPFNLVWYYSSNYGLDLQKCNAIWGGSDGSAMTATSANFIAPVNQWNHVAFGYDTATKHGYMWINGVQHQDYDGPLTADPVTTGTSPFIVGAAYDPDAPWRFFDGRIRAVRMFDSLLTTEEVAAVAAETWDDTLNIWTQPDLAYVQWPPGSEPQVMLRMSNDGGKNWGPEIWRPVGKVGQYGKRVRWNRLGSGRQRVFEVSVTDPIEWKITAAYLKANQSES